jgi:hypothetical protein
MLEGGSQMFYPRSASAELHVSLVAGQLHIWQDFQEPPRSYVLSLLSASTYVTPLLPS